MARLVKMTLSPALLSWETGLYNSKFPVFHSEYWVLDSNSAIRNPKSKIGTPHLSQLSCDNTGQVGALPFTLVFVPDKKLS